MIRKEFWRNVLPAMIAFAFSGIYSIVDGMFIGRSVGDAGLAAINIAYPITALIQAAGTGLGMAGAIGRSISLGRSDQQEERYYLGNTVTLLLFTGAVLTLLLLLLSTPLLRLFGAQGQVLSLARSYIQIIVLGAVFQVLGTGLVPIIRTYDGAMAAMMAMGAGFVTNVTVDWLLVTQLNFDTAGAAIATVAAQAVTSILCLRFLFQVKKALQTALYRPTKRIVRWLLLTALSPFGLTLSPNITIILLNRFSLQWGGDLAVTCYAVVSYAIYVGQLLLQGVGDGAQPMLGRYYGAGDQKSLWQVRRLLMITSPATALVCLGGLFGARNLIPVIFGTSPRAAQMFVQVLPCFLLSLLFLAFARSFTSYFYATEQARMAYILIYGEPLILFLSLCLLPRFFKLDGVWMAVPTTQIVLALLGTYLMRRLLLRPKILPMIRHGAAAGVVQVQAN